MGLRTHEFLFYETINVINWVGKKLWRDYGITLRHLPI